MPHKLWSILRASLFMLAALSIPAYAAESTPSGPRVEPQNSSQISRVVADAARTVSRPQAEPQNSSESQERGKAWKISAGTGPMYRPIYQGSDNYRMIPFPDIAVEYENGLFFMNIWDGVGSYPLRGENYKVGASAGVSWGRRESDDRDNLRGMGDIERGPTANLLGEYRLGPVRLSGKITAGTEDYGVTAQGRLGTMFPVARQFMLMGSVSATWADQEHMETYFGVSSAQSARSGYRRHHMDSGMKSVGFTAGVFYAVTDLWNVKLVVGGEQLVGHAADSPITKNAFNPYVLLTQVYKF